MTSQDHKRLAALLRSPLRRSRAAHDAALYQIGLAIVCGRFPPDSLLPRKEELSAWLAVSHVTLREALQTLSAKGMITARTRIGTRVLPERHWNMFDADLLAWRLEVGIPPSFLSALLEIRQSIEPLAAALAATRRTPEDLERLRHIVELMRIRPGQTPGRTDEFVEADVAFHRSILEISGNPFMASLSPLVGAALSVSFGVGAPTQDRQLARLVHEQHKAILDAIIAGDPQRASEAMVVAIRQGWLKYCREEPSKLVTVELRTFPIAAPAAPSPSRPGYATMPAKEPTGT